MTSDAVAQALKGLPEWAEVGEAIQRTFQFDTFKTAMAFVNQVASEAEASQHHPDILIRYSRVTLTLATHDAGGISAKDFAAAAKADQLAAALPCAATPPAPARAARGKKKP